MTRGMTQLVRNMVEMWKAMASLWARGLRSMRGMGCFWERSTVLSEPTVLRVGSDIVEGDGGVLDGCGRFMVMLGRAY